jgi:hypothetical protein
MTSSREQRANDRRKRKTGECVITDIRYALTDQPKWQLHAEAADAVADSEIKKGGVFGKNFNHA